MNTKSCTDIYQGYELVKAGVNLPANFYITPKVGGYVVSTEKAANSDPSFGVVELLESIPTTIQVEGSSYKFEFGYSDGFYHCHYVDANGFETMNFDKWEDCSEMLKEVWLWLIGAEIVESKINNEKGGRK